MLLCIVFLSILIVAFMSSMSAKLQLSKAGADMGKVQILAETAVNIAISQVHDATVLAGENRYAWASQPGMIRLYNQAGINNRCYKLYSWDNMVTDTAFQPFDAAEQVCLQRGMHRRQSSQISMPPRMVCFLSSTTTKRRLWE